GSESLWYNDSVPLTYLHSFPTRRSSDLLRPSSAAMGSARSRASCTSISCSSSRKAATSAIRTATTIPCSATRPHKANGAGGSRRSEDHPSELQSRENLVCRLLLGKKKIE